MSQKREMGESEKKKEKERGRESNDKTLIVVILIDVVHRMRRGPFPPQLDWSSYVWGIIFHFWHLNNSYVVEFQYTLHEEMKT